MIQARMRLRQEQADYLASLLHDEWVRLARDRAVARDEGRPEDVAAFQEPMRTVTTMQEELHRAREEMGWNE